MGRRIIQNLDRLGCAKSFWEALAPQITKAEAQTLRAWAESCRSIGSDRDLTAKQRTDLFVQNAAELRDHCAKELIESPSGAFTLFADSIFKRAQENAADLEEELEEAQLIADHPIGNGKPINTVAPPPAPFQSRSTKMTEFTTRRDVDVAMLALGKRARRDGESVAGACSRLQKGRDPEMVKLCEAWGDLPPDMAPPDEIEKSGESPAARAIDAEVAKIRKSEPTLSFSQAYTRVWKARPDLRDAFRDETAAA